MNITKRQSDVLEFIKQFIERNGFSPTYEEISTGLNLKSLATVHKHITNLETRGKIARAADRARSIEVLHDNQKARFRHEGPHRLYDSVLGCYWVKEITG